MENTVDARSVVYFHGLSSHDLFHLVQADSLGLEVEIAPGPSLCLVCAGPEGASSASAAILQDQAFSSSEVWSRRTPVREPASSAPQITRHTYVCFQDENAEVSQEVNYRSLTSAPLAYSTSVNPPALTGANQRLSPNSKFSALAGLPSPFASAASAIAASIGFMPDDHQNSKSETIMTDRGNDGGGSPVRCKSREELFESPGAEQIRADDLVLFLAV